ncbi:hypothetical protein QJS66_16340 [Kocuria rhizophila]|nr:hypothetical protein QJS66_16340 [Kocuria rhizophila]
MGHGWGHIGAQRGVPSTSLVLRAAHGLPTRSVPSWNLRPARSSPEEARVGLTHHGHLADRPGPRSSWRRAPFGGRVLRRRLPRGGRAAHLPEEAWAQAELLVKVKEPIPAEYGFLRSDLTVFAYLHLAASRELAGHAGQQASPASPTRPCARRPDPPRCCADVRDRGAPGDRQRRAPPAVPRRRLRHPAGPRARCRPSTVLVIGRGAVGEHAAAPPWAPCGVTILEEADGDRIRQLDALFPTPVS